MARNSLWFRVSKCAACCGIFQQLLLRASMFSCRSILDSQADLCKGVGVRDWVIRCRPSTLSSTCLRMLDAGCRFPALWQGVMFRNLGFNSKPPRTCWSQDAAQDHQESPATYVATTRKHKIHKQPVGSSPHATVLRAASQRNRTSSFCEAQNCALEIPVKDAITPKSKKDIKSTQIPYNTIYLNLHKPETATTLRTRSSLSSL